MAILPFLDVHWREYRLDAMSFHFVKSTLEPDEPILFGPHKVNKNLKEIDLKYLCR